MFIHEPRNDTIHVKMTSLNIDEINGKVTLERMRNNIRVSIRLYKPISSQMLGPQTYIDRALYPASLRNRLNPYRDVGVITPDFDHLHLQSNLSINK